ncbi:MAG TPA: exodeoxyribonuclease VII small subunit [candidate division Zixibacteria bacterium]|jgi:exodeoxyribonuclease VII small subunit
MAATKPRTFEDQFARLEQIVAMLEGDDVALEAALALYAEGMELVRDCSKTLGAAEKKIEKITASLEKIAERESDDDDFQDGDADDTDNDDDA